MLFLNSLRVYRLVVIIYKNLFWNLNGAPVSRGFGVPAANNARCIDKRGTSAFHKSLAEAHSNTNGIAPDNPNTGS